MGQFLLEYIWIDGEGSLRSKTKVFRENIIDIEINNIPEWDYDGSSTKQADGNNSEVILKPVSIFNDPFRGNPNKLVLCDTWLPTGDPHPTNNRIKAKRIFDTNLALEPIFGIEQEFFLSKAGNPIGFPTPNLPLPQGSYYCGLGGDNIFGRECIEKAFTYCLLAGVSLTGLNSEVAPSQWEFQVCAPGINCADQIMVTRWIINRVAEEYGWNLDIRPKPIKGDWNGSGCHTNFSTKAMRDTNGIDHINKAIERLKDKHDIHIKWYGEGNKDRLTGVHETASWQQFSHGIANRSASVRIPNKVSKNEKGYFEDRRPASNMDPYIVSSLIFATSCNIDQKEFI